MHPSWLCIHLIYVIINIYGLYEVILLDYIFGLGLQRGSKVLLLCFLGISIIEEFYEYHLILGPRTYRKIYSVVYLNISVYLKNYLRYLLFWCDNLHNIYRWCMLCICYYVVAIFNVWQRWTTSKFFCINASFPV